MDDFLIKEIECQGCKTQIRGNFKANRFHLFTPDDLYFIEIFLKNEGNIKLMEKELSVSYPTVKGRLKQIIKTLGYQTEEKAENQRIRILTELSEGKIDVNDAVKTLGHIK